MDKEVLSMRFVLGYSRALNLEKGLGIYKPPQIDELLLLETHFVKDSGGNHETPKRESTEPRL